VNPSEAELDLVDSLDAVLGIPSFEILQDPPMEGIMERGESGEEGGQSPARSWSTLSVATLLLLATLAVVLLACFFAADAGLFAGAAISESPR